MRTLLLFSSCLIMSMAMGQVVWTEPAFPSSEEPLTLYYNAGEGNGELAGIFPVYIHAGLITSESATPSSWQNVIMPWGSADPQWELTSEGDNIWSYDFGGQNLNAFFGLSEDIEAQQLAMVFRNADGSLVGRDSDGGDLFVPLSSNVFEALILQPQDNSLIGFVSQPIQLVASASGSADLAFVLNGDTLTQAADTTDLNWAFVPEAPGTFVLEFHADNGELSATDQLTVVVLPEDAPVAPPPPGTQDGINPSSDGNSAVLQLYAPGKSHVFFVGDITNWEIQESYLMNASPEGDRFWIEITGINPAQEYRYQYHVMPNNARFGDPYAEKQLDFWNDPWIPNATYPFLIGFPEEADSQSPVSVLNTNPATFDWTDSDFERPEQENLVIYELLVRDFSDARTFDFILDTLDYLASLNVTALELMPINEFNGNDSWGYNPSFYFAVDKAYGPKAKLQALVDACHERGIAVILDMVMNHSDWPNPQILMWWENGAPAADNPFFNTAPPANGVDFFFDYDHQATATRDFTKRVMDFWREEFHIDGMRWDLSQGFTWNGSGGSYDQDRIDLWAEYGYHVWNQDPGFYMILEHWTDNNEEKALSDIGFMTWANVTHDYQEAAMGYGSNLAWASWQERGWNHPRSVSYMESHDEERLMYKALEFGGENGDYDVTNTQTALSRMEAAACFHLPLPGPKMIWQFGELGYDYSINTCSDGVTISEDCRVAAKPVRWDYQESPNRYRIYQVMSALAGLKRDHPVFQTSDFNWDVWGFGKRLQLNGNDMDVVVAANFGTSSLDMAPGFQHTGTWHDFFSGESLEVSDLSANLPFAPGEYHVWTDVELETPENIMAIHEARLDAKFDVAPNPGTQSVVSFHASMGPCTMRILDLTGRVIWTENIPAGMAQWPLPSALPEGPYVVRVVCKEGATSQHWLKQR